MYMQSMSSAGSLCSTKFLSDVCFKKAEATHVHLCSSFWELSRLLKFLYFLQKARVCTEANIKSI